LYAGARVVGSRKIAGLFPELLKSPHSGANTPPSSNSDQTAAGLFRLSAQDSACARAIDLPCFGHSLLAAPDKMPPQ
jgi:hypothetical protein